jgi:hypothetical protein
MRAAYFFAAQTTISRSVEAAAVLAEIREYASQESNAKMKIFNLAKLQEINKCRNSSYSLLFP